MITLSTFKAILPQVEILAEKVGISLHIINRAAFGEMQGRVSVSVGELHNGTAHRMIFDTYGTLLRVYKEGNASAGMFG